ncbi:chemotaxis protein CheR [Cystobacter fuscus]|uniref:CheR family methyltransferase n=1 Tax=Cystobacter fuscus TaxID=43 RepID=UPI002B2D70D8|nr:chemotaxis protein CheR [Cystobacter fuscus]
MSDSTPPWRHWGYTAVLEFVAARAGLLTPSCLAAAMEGIDRAMARAGLAEDFSAYLPRLEADPAALDDLLVELTVGETYFFRNPEHFDFLRQEVLPDLRQHRGEGHVVRGWSAGCSSGEEPYSLAVLLMKEGHERMEVLGTDVSRAALARCEEASYGEWSLRGPWVDHMRPYLHPDGKRYRLAPEVRSHVRFGYLNLAEDSWPSTPQGVWGMDIIFCRNVLIYFNRPTIEGVARRLHATLADGGFLITGPSDPPLNGLAPFETIVTEWGIVYHRPDATRPTRLRSFRHTPLQVVPPASDFPHAPPPATAPLPEPAPAPPPLPAPPPAPPAPPPPAAPGSGLDEARQALTRGDWREAARLAAAMPDDAEAVGVTIRALANFDAPAALRACAEASERHPLAVEPRYLESLVLLGQGKLRESERAARQALYLEPGLAVAHLMLGHILRRQGELTGARRAFSTAAGLCAALPPEQPVPLADGERAGRLLRVAREELQRLDDSQEKG